MRLSFFDHFFGSRKRSARNPFLIDNIDEIEILPVRYDTLQADQSSEPGRRRKREVQRLIIDNAQLRELEILNEPGCCLIRVNQRSRLVIYADCAGHAILSEQCGSNIVIHIYRELHSTYDHPAPLECEPGIRDG